MEDTIPDFPPLSPRLQRAIVNRFTGKELPAETIKPVAEIIRRLYLEWPKHQGSGRPLPFEEISASNAAVHATDWKTLARNPKAMERFLEDWLRLRKPYLTHTLALRTELKPRKLNRSLTSGNRGAEQEFPAGAEEEKEALLRELSREQADAIAFTQEALWTVFRRDGGGVWNQKLDPSKWVHHDQRTRAYLSKVVRDQGARIYWSLKFKGLPPHEEEEEAHPSVLPGDEEKHKDGGWRLPPDEHLIKLERRSWWATYVDHVNTTQLPGDDGEKEDPDGDGPLRRKTIRPLADVQLAFGEASDSYQTLKLPTDTDISMDINTDKGWNYFGRLRREQLQWEPEYALLLSVHEQQAALATRLARAAAPRALAKAPRQLAVFMARTSGKTYKEIAEELGGSEGAARNAYHHAIRNPNLQERVRRGVGEI